MTITIYFDNWKWLIFCLIGKELLYDVCDDGPVVERSLRVPRVPGSNLCEVKIVSYYLEGYRSWNEKMRKKF